jgi:nitrate reductase gamma subunit
VSRGDLLVWVVFPYAALVVFAVGHVWRWRSDQFGWTTRSTQLLERRWLWWGSNLFHFGALLAIGGHVVGILIPKSVTRAAGVPESTYHHASVAMGSLAGLMCLAGLVILILRRLLKPRVAVTTTTADLVAYAAITVAIVTGVIATSGYQIFTDGYDYRTTVAPYFRGIFMLDPVPSRMTSAPALYQLHVLASFALYALWPFTRLVHVWSVPWRYLMRRPIVYRAARQGAPTARRR